LDDAVSERWADVGYLGRLTVGDRPLIIIAGVHALGSVGVVDYLTRNLAELYAQVGMKNFSMAIASEHDGDTVVRSEAVCPARTHD
jgi:hypothetical protein